MSTTRSSLAIKINCPDQFYFSLDASVEMMVTIVARDKNKLSGPILFFSKRRSHGGHDRRPDEKINLGFEILFFHRDVGRVVAKSTTRHPSAGCLTPLRGVFDPLRGGRVTSMAMTPMTNRFGPRLHPQTDPETGESVLFAKRGADSKKQGRFPDLYPEHGVSKLTPLKKKIYFLQRVFDPSVGCLDPLNIDATSRTVVDVDGSPLVTTFRVRNRGYSTPYGLAARDIFFFIFCATASPSATE